MLFNMAINYTNSTNFYHFAMQLCTIYVFWSVTSFKGLIYDSLYL